MLHPEVGRAILAHSSAFFNLKDLCVLSFDTTTDGNRFYFRWCLHYSLFNLSGEIIYYKIETAYF